MSLLDRVLGPESKYDHRLPYTYEATVAVAGVPGMKQSWVCDTLCGLLEKLSEEKVAPSEATIFEVRPEGEVRLLVEHCVDPDGMWLRRPEACRSFEEHYAGHERKGQCCYRDRSREAEGPFVEYAPGTPKAT
jgi:hypothetical protein